MPMPAYRYQMIAKFLDGLVAPPGSTARYDWLSATARQFVRYSLASGIAFLIDIGTLTFLIVELDVPVLLAAPPAFLLGLLTNYWISLRWVFHRRALQSRRNEFVIFTLIGVVGMGINELGLWLAIDVFSVGWVAGKLAATAVSLVWNFSLRKGILFR